MPNFSRIGERHQERVALALAQALPGSALKDLVGEETGRGYHYIRECCLVSRRTQPLDVILTALELTGHQALYDLFETDKLQITPKFQGETGSTDDLAAWAMAKAVEMGETVAAIQAAVAPDSEGGTSIKKAEKKRILMELANDKRLIAQLEDYLNRL